MDACMCVNLCMSAYLMLSSLNNAYTEFVVKFFNEKREKKEKRTKKRNTISFWSTFQRCKNLL